MQTRNLAYRILSAMALLALLLGSASIPRTAALPPTLDGVADTTAPFSASSDSSTASAVQNAATQQAALDTVQGASLMFIENVGQFDEGARFRVYGADWHKSG